MKVICFSGNLGNQIFYCRYKDYLQKKYLNEKIYFYVTRNCPKVKVQDVFDLELPLQSKRVNILSFSVFEILGRIFSRIPKKCLPHWYCSNLNLINDEATFIAHYLQDKCFYEDEKSDWLKIKMPSKLSDEYLMYSKLIQESDSVAIHIRRGDYIHPGSFYYDLTSSDYYERAIALVKSKYPHAKFFFFSDDLDYVQNRFKMENSYYVDCNSGANSFLDIKLMSLAKVNIIANSTFSYWGAYMNHEEKLVIYPSRWFNDFTGRQAPNIMLNSWIQI